MRLFTTLSHRKGAHTHYGHYQFQARVTNPSYRTPSSDTDTDTNALQIDRDSRLCHLVVSTNKLRNRWKRISTPFNPNVRASHSEGVSLSTGVQHNHGAYVEINNGMDLWGKWKIQGIGSFDCMKFWKWVMISREKKIMKLLYSFLFKNKQFSRIIF